MFQAPQYCNNFDGLWRSTLSTLDYIYVLKGIKRCSLEYLDADKISTLQKFSRANDFCFELSDYKILFNREKAKGGFSNSCSRISVDSANGLFVVFLSKDRMDAQLAKHYCAISDHVKLGALLSYPSCCLHFFTKCVKKRANKKMDFIRDALTDIRQHDFYNNRALRYFDISLLSHFPCSLDCQASKAIARERLSFLRKENPKIAKFFERHLKSMVIYSEEQGVFFSNDYSVDQNVVKYRNLHGTIENDLFHKLEDNSEVTLSSHNSLLVGSSLVDDDVGVLLFK